MSTSIMENKSDAWNSSSSYDFFMGRWSALMAAKFLKWLDLPDGLRWLDVGCGTGALSESITKQCHPSKLCCVDPSEEFAAGAKQKLQDAAEVKVGSASNIPFDDSQFDVVVSGLAMNFFPDLQSALHEMKRVMKRPELNQFHEGNFSKKSRVVAAYVWDYADKMEFLRYFWNAAVQLSPQAESLDEGHRFPVCNPEKLADAFKLAGLNEVETTFLDIETVFKNFDDYWNPFLGSQGPAPGYLASLAEDLQTALRNEIRKNLPVEADGSIRLIARAIAVRGIVE